MRERGDSGMFSKRGQVTIFVIIAVVVVGIIAMIYLFVPRAQTGTNFDAQNPNGFIQNCLEEEIGQTVETISMRGGSLNPEFYFKFDEVNIEYLCYTNDPIPALCVPQRPLLQQHIESEVEQDISEEVTSCFNALVENYNGDGYNTNLQTGRTNVELLPNRIVVNFSDYILTASKDETERHDSFSVVLNNNLYELVSIAKSIVEWETTLGEADVRVYNNNYPHLDVDKNPRDDGTKIYTVTDLNTGDQFQFASRSFVFLPGH